MMFLALALITIFIGYVVEDGIVLKITGFLFLFTLGVILLNGTLQVEIGGQVLNNGSGTYITKSYEEYQSFTFGFYMSLLAVFGFILSYFENKNKRMEDYD